MERTHHRGKSLHRAATTAALLTTILVLRAGPAAGDGIYEQVFELQPGWNAVFVELAPLADEVETAFAGLPVESVWTWNSSETSVDFVQDPSDELFDVPGWSHYVPPPRAESILNNLFFLLPNRAYLIHLGGSQPAIWKVRGRPTLRPSIVWQTNSFSLVGFKIDAANPPTFGAWLAPSPAHDGQPIYRLDPSGVWQPIASPETTSIRAGEACWVYTRGASTYQGPLEVEVPFGGGLEFAQSLDTGTVIVRNASGLDTLLRLRRLDGVGAVPLAYQHEDETTGETSWPLLPDLLTVESVAGQEHLFDLGVRRAELQAARTESILEISNDLGARLLVPVTVTATSAAATPGSRHARAVRSAPSADLAGLWAGEVRVNAVSESQLGGAVPIPTGAEFTFRILIHLDGAHQARLLKEVIQMWQNGTTMPDPVDPSFMIVDQPGHYVLLTDETLIPQFEGASLRDGVPVGFRLSTAAYDFPGQWETLDGTFGLGGSLTWTLVLESEAPTNPFRHPFHPDHDNLDERFLNFREEAFTITRNMELVFAGNQVGTGDPPGWGSTVIGGVFREAISGVHRNSIFVEGSFELTRVTTTPVLNQ